MVKFVMNKNTKKEKIQLINEKTGHVLIYFNNREKAFQTFEKMSMVNNRISLVIPNGFRQKAR